MGDLNCDVSKLTPDLLIAIIICSLYQLPQDINEPTRVTETTSTLI